MWKFMYENQGNNIYLVYKLEEQEEIDTISIGMLSNNRIPGIAPVSFMQLNEEKYIYFNITSKKPASSIFNGVVGKKNLLGLFSGIVNAILSANDYMLNKNTIIYDMDYIFINPGTGETNLICMPVESEGIEVSLSDFFRKIMFESQFDQNENCDYVTKLISYLNGSVPFSIYTLKKIIEELENKDNIKRFSEETTNYVKKMENKSNVKENPVRKEVSQKEQNIIKNFVDKQNEEETVHHKDGKKDTDAKKMSFLYLMQHYNKDNAAAYKAQKAQNKQKSENNIKVKPEKKNTQSKKDYEFDIPGRDGFSDKKIIDTHKDIVDNVPKLEINNEKTVLSELGSIVQTEKNERTMETTVLNITEDDESSEEALEYYLIREKTFETIRLSKKVFCIGKSKTDADYRVEDSKVVSRKHANIIIKQCNCYIIDLNSTNHTYVNGVRLQSNVETLLQHGDIIRLANENFEFRMY